MVTFPLGKEGLKLGYKLLMDNIRSNLTLGKNRIMAVFEPLAQTIVGVIYLPLLFRRANRGRYSIDGLKMMIGQLSAGELSVEEDYVYQDYIIYGTKIMKNGGRVNVP